MTKTMIKHEEMIIHVSKGLLYALFILAICAAVIYGIWIADWASIVAQFDEKKVGFTLDFAFKAIISLSILASVEAISMPKSREGLISGLIAGLISGLILGLIWGLISSLMWGLIWGLTAGLIAGLISGLNEK